MFTLLFDTTNVGMTKYCFRTAAFIKKLKKAEGRTIFGKKYNICIK